MGVVNFRKLFCQDLRAVAHESAPALSESLVIYDWNQQSKDPDDFCSEMTELGIKDHVTIEQGTIPGSMLLSYKSASGPGSFWFFDDGKVYVGPHTKSPAFNMGVYPLIIMGALFGTRALSAEGRERLQSNTVFTSATEYLRCLSRKKPTRCAVEKEGVATRSIEDQVRRKQETDERMKMQVKTDPELMEKLGLDSVTGSVHRIHGQYEIAKRIWQRVDAFIRP